MQSQFSLLDIYEQNKYELHILDILAKYSYMSCWTPW